MVADGSAPITILFVEPNNVTRAGLRVLLSGDTRFEIVWDGPRLEIDVVRGLQPDVIVTDPRKEGTFDLALLTEVRRVSPASRVIFYTRPVEPGDLLTGLRTAPSGYLLKSQDVDTKRLRQAIVSAVRLGVATVDLEVLAQLPDQPAGESARRAPWPLLKPLTEQELEILTLLGRGKRDKAIGDRLGIAETTVGTHVQAICVKLRAKTSFQAGALAVLHGLVTVSEDEEDEESERG